jgi:DNA polymerase III subunit beta
MNIKCNRVALYEAVQLASSIVPARTPKPILQCAKIQADQKEQRLTVTATDNEITVKYIVPQVQVNAEGAAVLPADKITSILHEGADETVDLEVNDSTCQVVGKDSRFRIYGHDPDDFPVIGELQKDEVVQIKAGVLKRMIHRTLFAAARENTRYAINGVLWEQHGKTLRMVATDGRRLAMIDGEVIPGDKDAEQTAIVPAKAWTVIDKILHDPEEKIQISFSGNQMTTNTALAEITCNLVQGRFPKYVDVVPCGCNKKAQLEAEVFRSAVRRAALLSTEQSRGVLLSFSGEKLCLTSSTPETGDAEINMNVKYSGEDLKIGFNPQYLSDALRVIEEPEVVFDFVESTKPGLLSAGKDFRYVIMPVSV